MRAERREVLGKIKLAVASGERSGKIVAQLDDVSKSYDRPIVRNFSCTILRGDKVGLIGPNGAGKTTLLKLILGEIAPDCGDIKLGTKIEVAYFDQMRNNLDLDASLEDFISPGSEWVEINGERKHVKSYLGDFLFPPQRASAPVKTLSGGERNRLLLARLFAKPANVLVLDEPTNDLDVETLDLLEQLLQDYSGTVFLVSHDRYFLDRVVTSVIAYEGGGNWRENIGGYEDWVIQSQRTKNVRHDEAARSQRTTKPMSAREARPAAPVLKSQSVKKLSGKERQELTEIPDRIERLEKEEQNIHLQLADPLVYKDEPARVAALTEELKTLERELALLMRRWEELLEKEAAA
jgi:ATP-binding cassette subfamily F protein uup